MKNCCICANTINILKGSSTVEFNSTKYEICSECIKNRNKLYAENESILNDAITYFSECLRSQKVEENAIALVESYIEKANKSIDVINDNKDEFQKQYENVKITSGYNYEGYIIEEYIDVVSTSVVIGTGFISESRAAMADFLGTESKAFSKKMNDARESAKISLIKCVAQKGGNAIIGMQYNMFSLGSNMIAISANGTAVKIKSIFEVQTEPTK